MAIRTDGRELTEEELYSPDLDEGDLDVETFRLPNPDSIDDPYLAELVAEAQSILDEGSDDESSVER